MAIHIGTIECCRGCTDPEHEVYHRFLKALTECDKFAWAMSQSASTSSSLILSHSYDRAADTALRLCDPHLLDK